MTHVDRLTRRQVLAGLAGASTLGAGVTLARFAPSDRPYTAYTLAATPDQDEVIRVAWYETYNDAFQEATDGATETNASVVLDRDATPLYVPDAPGAVVSLPNVLPGDHGRLVVGLEALAPVSVSFAVPPLLTAENGVTEPEVAAGDTTAAGELQDAVLVRVWRDVGVSGVGRCDGEFGVLGIEEPLLTQGPGGFESLASFAGRFRDPVALEPCLGEGETVCLGLDWRLPAGTTDRVQTDSVEFALAFLPDACADVGVGQ